MDSFDLDINYLSEYPKKIGFQTGEIYYDLWAVLDIKVNERGFFKSFKCEFQKEMGNSSVSNRGVTVPLISVLEQFSYLPNQLLEQKEVIISNDQIDKDFVFKLLDNKVIFGLCYDYFSENRIWYNGETLIKSFNLIASEKFTLNYDNFNKRLLLSLKSICEHFLKQQPDLINSIEFNNVFKIPLNYDN